MSFEPFTSDIPFHDQPYHTIFQPIMDSVMLAIADLVY